MRLAAVGALCAALVSAAHAQSDHDVLKAFEEKAEICRASFAAQPIETVTHNADTGRWYKSVMGPLSSSHDVKRSNSLVTPFTGELRLEWMLFSVDSAAESDVRASAPNDRDNTIRARFLINYSFSKGSWHTTGGKSWTAWRAKGERRFDDSGYLPISPDQFEKAPLKGCK